MAATTLEKNYDPQTLKRNQLYRYVIQPYRIHYSRLPGEQLGIADFKGAMKQIQRTYDYLYMGKNKDVINFNLKFIILSQIILQLAPFVNPGQLKKYGGCRLICDWQLVFFGLRLIQLPNAVEQWDFLTVDGGATWRVLGVQWSNTASRDLQDIFLFGYPDSGVYGFPAMTDGYGSLASSNLSASYIDWIVDYNKLLGQDTTQALENDLANLDEIMQKVDPNIICLDVANGYMHSFVEKCAEVRAKYPTKIIIAGNVSTPDATRDLISWGADVIKVGIGPGCLKYDTQISMADGTYKNISNIKVGDKVMNMYNKPVTVLNVLNQGFREVLKIRFADTNSSKTSNIYVTPDHKFYNSCEWIEIDNLNIKDTVLDCEHNRYKLIVKTYYGIVQTYDIEVDCPTHSFIANNMIVHNSACTTYPNTGFGSRDIQAYCVRECAEEANLTNTPIIADGGISQVCDIAKSLVMGAQLIMIGGMLTGFEESPGNLVVGQDNKLYQEFYGSASEHSKTHTGDKKTKNIEGTIRLVPYKNKSIFKYYDELTQALQSSVSYGGGKDLSIFSKVKYIVK